MGILSKLKERRGEIAPVKKKSDVVREVKSAEEGILKGYVDEFNEGFDDAVAHALAQDSDDEMFIVFAKTLKGMKDYVAKEGIDGKALAKILKRSRFIDAVVKLCTERKR